MRASSPLERRQQRDEIIRLIGESREDKQAHERQVLTENHVRAKELADIKAKQGMARQRLINQGSLDTTFAQGQFGLRRQGLANQGALNIANTSGQFGLKRQGLSNTGSVDVANVRGKNALAITERQQTGENSRLGRKLTQAREENALNREAANSNMRFKLAGNLLSSGAVSGEEADRVSTNSYEPFSGIDRYAKPNRVYYPEKRVPGFGGKGYIVEQEAQMFDKNSGKVTKLNQENSLFPGLNRDETLILLRDMRENNPEMYNKLREQAGM